MRFARVRFRLANLIVPGYTVRHGFPAEWPLFIERHSMFLARLPLLVAVGNRTFIRGFDADLEERVLFGLGFLVWEDFEDIQVLAGNGRGFGCQKILRGMFERVVTTARLHSHPEDTSRFVDFHYVSDYKLARAVHESFGERAITAAQLADKKTLRDNVKQVFTRKCPLKGCEYNVDAISWINLDMVTLSKTFPDLGKIIGEAYYIPMAYSHPSIQAILQHIDETGFMGSPGRQRHWVPPVLAAAHYLTLKAIEIQMNHFPELLPLIGKDFAQCVKDYGEIWGKSAE